MPLPSTTVSLSNIKNVTGIVGSIDMNIDAARKLCGVSRSSGVSWSLQQAQGKAWVTGVTPNQIGYIQFAITGGGSNAFNGGGTGTYAASVYLREHTFIGAGTFYWGYTYNAMTDTGGGYTSAPTLIKQTFSRANPPGTGSETMTGILSGSG